MIAQRAIDERSPDRRRAIVVFLTCFVAAAAIGLMTGEFRTLSVDQPVAFNHRTHVVDNKLDCATCHRFSAMLPAAGLCSPCHTTPQGKTAEEAKLVNMLRRGQPLVWNSVFGGPVPIEFPHRAHVVKGRLACERCHSSVALATYPPRRVRVLRMADCIECHEERNVSVECTTCHR